MSMCDDGEYVLGCFDEDGNDGFATVLNPTKDVLVEELRLLRTEIRRLTRRVTRQEPMNRGFSSSEMRENAREMVTRQESTVREVSSDTGTVNISVSLDLDGLGAAHALRIGKAIAVLIGHGAVKGDI